MKIERIREGWDKEKVVHHAEIKEVDDGIEILGLEPNMPYVFKVLELDRLIHGNASEDGAVKISDSITQSS